jgi:hypothetical protein
VWSTISRGVFRFPGVPSGALDQYAEATLWPLEVRGVHSHATALDLHDLCDIDPSRVNVTVPSGFRSTRTPPNVIRLHHENLPEHEITWHEGLPIVTVYRAILGSIQQHVGWSLIEQAIDTARRQGRLTREAGRRASRSPPPNGDGHRLSVSAKPHRIPGNLSHLQRLANAAAADAAVPAGGYRRWINTHVISAVLDRICDEEGDPLFALKRGAATELRLGLTARASKDYEAAFRARADDMLWPTRVARGAPSSSKSRPPRARPAKRSIAFPLALLIPSRSMAPRAHRVRVHTDDVQVAPDDLAGG